MPRPSPNGLHVLHGVGGGNASIDNVTFSPGGVCDWLDDNRVAFANGADNWFVCIYDLTTKQIVHAYEPPMPANIGFAGGGHVCSWLGGTDGNRGVWSTTGFRAPDSGLMGMGLDGSIGYKPLYQSHGPTHVRELDGTDWTLTPGHAANLQLFGQRRAIWQEAFSVQVLNLPQPLVADTQGIWAACAVLLPSSHWISYYSAARGIVLHPFNSFMGYSVLPKGDGWHKIARISETIIRVYIAVGEGEQAGQMWCRDYDIEKNLIRDPWGSGIWTPVEKLDVRTINMIEPPPPPPPSDSSNGWFPRLDKFGNIVSGMGAVWYRGKEVLRPGYKPQWLVDAQTFVCQGEGDQLVKCNLDGTGFEVLHGPMQVFAAGAGKWYVPNRAAGEIAGTIDPITGDVIVVRENNGSNNDRDILVNGVVVFAHGPVNDPRAYAGMVVWRNYSTNTQGLIDGQVKNLAVIKAGWEGNPVPVVANGERWLVFMTNIDIRLRPLESTQGYIIPTGEDMNFTPDAVGHGRGIRVTWNDKNGGRYTTDVDISLPRTDVTVGVPGTPIDPPPPPPPVETEAMEMSQNVYDTYVAVEAKFRNRGTDEQRREANRKAVATVRARHGGKWVCKSEHNLGWGSDSKDAMGYVPDGPVVHGAKAKMFMWDMVTSAGNVNPRGSAETAREAYVLIPEAFDWLTGVTDPIDPGQGDTHLYIGGGNDTNTCDTCGKSRFDAIHAIPQSKAKHIYNGGEQDTGLCDICQQASVAAIHDLKPPPDPPDEPEPTVKHEFVGTGKFCGECGKPKADSIHQMDVPAPGDTVDMSETNSILRELLAETKGMRKDLVELGEGLKLVAGALGSGTGGVSLTDVLTELLKKRK